MFINKAEIQQLLMDAQHAPKTEVREILDRAWQKKGLKHRDIAVLLANGDAEVDKEIFEIAGKIKKDIYGNRIVVFAPLYVSDYCVNDCTYCGYKHSNCFTRRKLTMAEVEHEVKILESMGHKRLALEAGEDPVNCTLDYIIECIDTIYKTPNENGSIRRVNVNVAATTVEEYKRLKAANIGTYILFQETYDEDAYRGYHPKGPKHNFEWHTLAFDRAMEAGIEDVGGGALFGLSDPLFEVLALMIHNEHLEERFGVGFHTISVPRMKPADGVKLEQYPHMVSDEVFMRLVAIIRLAVPFTGIILSTRETAEMRKELIKYGVSQVSAGSCTGVGGYKDKEEHTENNLQFKTSDERSPLEVLKELLDDGNIPSYCTACYRMGRTGDRFMQLAKSGQIHNVCTPNALMTLMEYACDYGDSELFAKAEAMIAREVALIERADIRALTVRNLDKIRSGERDLFL